jgi:hypothetical protein
MCASSRSVPIRLWDGLDFEAAKSSNHVEQAE